MTGLLRAALLATFLLGTPATQAQQLGRLFFTPEQRDALDARRRARVPDKPAAVPQVESPVTRVDGAVRRSSGRSTVWVNGEAIPEGMQAESPHVARRNPNPGSVSIPAGEGGPEIDLQVGQSLDRGSGEVRRLIGDGEIKVGPRRGAARK